jgi:hypothetical protein
MNVVNREVVTTRRIRLKWTAAIAVLVLGGLVVHGIVQRHESANARQ